MRWIRPLGRLGKGRRSRALVADLVDLLPPEGRDLVGHERLLDRLRSCAHPDLYVAQLDASVAPAAVDRDWAVAHFLSEGARAGLRICALFNPQWYRQQLADRGRALPDDQALFFHWLTTGWEERIVPTPLFDEEYYRAQHPGLSGSWLFQQYLTRGCYRAQSRPSPLGRHHPGGADPTARERQRPLLLREMLHRGGEFDLARTSWLEEGCVAALNRYATLGTEPMQRLVARAAAIEPLVSATSPQQRRVSCPPHRHPRLYLAEQVEAMRLGLDRSSAGTVILLPVPEPSPELEHALQLARRYDASEPDSGVVIVGTDEPVFGAAGAEAGCAVVDLARQADGLGADQALAMLVDLVRGLGAHRVVVLGSGLGRDLLQAYGRQLSHEVEVVEGDVLSAPWGDG